MVSVTGVLLGSRDTRTNALFGQAIKAFLALDQADYAHGQDRADDLRGAARLKA